MKIRLLTFAILLATSGAFAKSAPTPSVAMAPNAEQNQAAVWVARFLTRLHYKTVPLDDAMSQEIFKRYIDTLDGEHWFLLKSDVDSFSRYQTSLDDAILEQDLKAPFELYQTYLKRVRERTDYARELVKGEFDLNIDERYVYDREDAPFAKTQSELDDLWRRRVKNDVLRLRLAGKEMPAIRTTLDKRYRDFQVRIEELDGEDVFQMFLNAYSTAIEPHTNYLGPRASENFNMQMRLSLEGIGALLQRDGDYTMIASLVVGGPAERAGDLKELDRIVAVGQNDSGPMVDVVGWRTDDVVELIRGKRNTVVRLEVLPASAGDAGKTTLIKITRDKVKLEEQAAKKRVIEYSENGVSHRIGVIELPAFYLDFAARSRGEPDFRSSTRDVSKLLVELKAQSVDSLVIDLRNNGGGSLSEATELTGLFIDQGPVVQVRNSQGRVEVFDDPNAGVSWSGPLAVVVNRASASASEIFAGAIQDYGRGLILGETTFGKGTVQNLVDLDNIANTKKNSLGELKMTVQQFFRVSGGSTQHKGVVPDIAFPATMNSADFGESSYDNALPYTEIKPAGFQRVGSFNEELAILKARYESRSKQDPEFKFLLEDLAEIEKARDEKSVSLLLSARKTERDQLEQKRLARNAARAALGDAKADEKTPRLDDGLDASERRLAERRAGEKAADKKEAEPDVLLLQAAHIIGDLASLSDPKQRTALVDTKGRLLNAP